MEINCLKCELFGKCNFFPSLSSWTGSCQFRIPRYWESEKEKNTTCALVCSIVEPVFWPVREDEELSKKTFFCDNATCPKKGWCNDGIASHCKLFHQPVATKKNNKEEYCYETSGNKLSE